MKKYIMPLVEIATIEENVDIMAISTVMDAEYTNDLELKVVEEAEYDIWNVE